MAAFEFICRVINPFKQLNMKTIILYCLLLLPFFSMAQSETHFFVHFDFDKHELTATAEATLDSFIQSGKTNAINSIQLHGHCDFVGNDTYNDHLSNQRVQAVKAYLLKNNFNESTFVTLKGHGKREPLNANATIDERWANRRVEIIVQKQNPDKIITPAPPAITEKTKVEKTITEQIEDTAVKSGTNIVLKNIYFVGARHELLPESMPILEELLAVMKKNKNLKIEIRGHICCLPGNVDGYDEQTGTNILSEERAKAVWQYLYDKGISLERIYYIGLGHSQPIVPYPEKSEEEKTMNRRVDIRILSK